MLDPLKPELKTVKIHLMGVLSQKEQEALLLTTDPSHCPKLVPRGPCRNKAADHMQRAGAAPLPQVIELERG